MRTTSHYLLWLLFLYVIEGMALHLNAELDAGCQRFLARVRSEGAVWLLIARTCTAPGCSRITNSDLAGLKVEPLDLGVALLGEPAP